MGATAAASARRNSCDRCFSGLHAVPVRDGVYFAQAWDRFDATGRPREGDASARAAHRMLDQLAWYGHALRQARAAWPYPAG